MENEIMLNEDDNVVVSVDITGQGFNSSGNLSFSILSDNTLFIADSAGNDLKMQLSPEWADTVRAKDTIKVWFSNDEDPNFPQEGFVYAI